MATFDFITDDRLREVLESDYRELEANLKSESWKSVHVMAGSIIEAVLMDYLETSGASGRTTAELQGLVLGELVQECRTANIISQMATELSSVVRTYRNLIHPGRQLRLNEKVTSSSASIAKHLVEVIVEEIATKKRETYGYTAEQIVTNLEQDQSKTSILGHIFKTTKPREIERLLCKVIPQHYFEVATDFEVYDDVIMDEDVIETFNHIHKMRDALSQCFRLAFDRVDDDVKKKVTSQFVSVLKEETEYKVLNYGTAFFRATDLQYLPLSDIEMVKQHLFGRLKTNIDNQLLDMLTGLGAYITVQEMEQFADPIIRTVLSKRTQTTNACAYLRREASYMNSEVCRRLGERLDMWIQAQKNNQQATLVNKLREIRTDILDESDPFADD